MSVRSDKATPQSDAVAALGAAADSVSLAEGSSFFAASPENPLQRNLVVSIKASLNDLVLKTNKGVWAPSPENLKAIFQQKKFTDLEGSAEAKGDLKSVVLHDMAVTQVSSNFPMSLGAKITGVDNNTFSSTGEPFSMVVLPNSSSSAERMLQKDDVSLAYEFAKKFPGYTADNLSTKGVHEVSQRRFVLVNADHPIVSAISENADRLQMGEIAMMPEGMIKVSSGLYESILPLVSTQVASQIKVRDFSEASVSISPAEFKSWDDARAALITEAKRPLKAQFDAEISAATDDELRTGIRAEFERRQAELEADLDHKPMEMHLSISCSYNFLSNS